MIRERVIAERTGRPVPYSDEEMAAVFTAMLAGLSGQRSTAAAASAAAR